MYQRIVVGTDDSPESALAVDVAADLARSTGAVPVHLVTGYHPMTGVELDRIAHDLPGEFRTGIGSDQTGEAIVGAAAQRLRSRGVTAEVHAVPDDAAEAILGVAAEVGADLIVIGSHGHNTGAHLIGRGVSTAVVHRADCSVLVVRPNGRVQPAS